MKELIKSVIIKIMPEENNIDEQIKNLETEMQNPDFIAIAKAYRIDGSEVHKREELDDAIADMLKDDKPYLLVVNVEKKGMVFPMVPSGTCVTNILLGD